MSTAIKKRQNRTPAAPTLDPQVAAPAKERNMGIELFRIVAMCLVLMLHVLGRGGVMGVTSKFSPQYITAHALEAIAYCCVDCYAIITGFTNVKSRFRYRRIVLLWLEVFTITVSSTLIAKFFFHVDVTPDEWKIALMPLTRRELWYFNAYFILFFFIPILNKGVQALERWQLRTTILTLLAAIMILTRLGDRDIFYVSSGYSAMWLMVLYLIGAYFRLYGFPKFAKWYVTLPTFFLCAGIALGQKLIAQKMISDGTLVKEDWLYKNESFLISYISPCMVLMAVCLLIFFGNLKIRFKVSKVIISNLGKATFGVFALHVATMVWNHYFKGRFAQVGKYPAPKMLLFVILITLGLFLVFSAYSLARIYLFKLLRINRLVDLIADRLPVKKKQDSANG